MADTVTAIVAVASPRKATCAVSSALAAMNGAGDRDRREQLRQRDLPARNGREREVRQRAVLDLVAERRRGDREHDERRDGAREHRAQDCRLELAAPTARAVERSISVAMTTGMAASTVMIDEAPLPGELAQREAIDGAHALALHQVAEHALERIVERLDSAQADRLPPARAAAARSEGRARCG